MTRTSGPVKSEPENLGDLVQLVLDRDGYHSLRAMAGDTSIPYQTIYAWSRGTRNNVRPPTEAILRTFASDFRLPEATVFRAAGRSYNGPQTKVDAEGQKLLELYGMLPKRDRERLIRIVAIISAMSHNQRVTAENVLRAISLPPSGDDSAAE